jgi:hypothetical protein
MFTQTISQLSYQFKTQDKMSVKANDSVTFSQFVRFPKSLDYFGDLNSKFKIYGII